MSVYLGDRITLEATFKDSDGNEYNPDSVKIYIYDGKNGLDSTITDPTNPSIGVFRKEYDIPDTAAHGSWRVVWEGTLGGGKKREQMQLTVNPI